mmetsp:Transcript_153843/g.268106  ORF Transcript_153843/g.268106 Transcript_153843/m.268106 type:complete len:86 (+) Transcript_153843:526-783(+)
MVIVVEDGLHRWFVETNMQAMAVGPPSETSVDPKWRMISCAERPQQRWTLIVVNYAGTTRIQQESMIAHSGSERFLQPLMVLSGL